APPASTQRTLFSRRFIEPPARVSCGRGPASRGFLAAHLTARISIGGFMAIFYIGTYDIIDPGAFQSYPPVVLSLLPKYGGVVLASDTSPLLVEGTAHTMDAILRFQA